MSELYSTEKTFALCSAYYEPVSHLTDKEAGRLFKSILAYENGEKIRLDTESEKMAFLFIKAQIDSIEN